MIGINDIWEGWVASSWVVDGGTAVLVRAKLMVWRAWKAWRSLSSRTSGGQSMGGESG